MNSSLSLLFGALIVALPFVLTPKLIKWYKSNKQVNFVRLKTFISLLNVSVSLLFFLPFASLKSTPYSGIQLFLSDLSYWPIGLVFVSYLIAGLILFFGKTNRLSWTSFGFTIPGLLSLFYLALNGFNLKRVNADDDITFLPIIILYLTLISFLPHALILEWKPKNKLLKFLVDPLNYESE